MNESAIYRALQKGASTEAEIRKASKLDEADVTDGLADMKNRLWVSEDADGKTSKFALTDEGRISLSSRYPDA